MYNCFLLWLDWTQPVLEREQAVWVCFMEIGVLDRNEFDRLLLSVTRLATWCLVIIISNSVQKSELLNPVMLAGPEIPLVSTETNMGKSASAWHQEIKKRGRERPFGKRMG